MSLFRLCLQPRELTGRSLPGQSWIGIGFDGFDRGVDRPGPVARRARFGHGVAGMATYAIGDVHGCAVTLERLLRRIGYRRGSDRLWLVGDLVNRGPGSLAVLRWAAEQGEGLVAVLGNHDLHLLARAAGLAKARRRDTLEAVLEAPDRDDLLAWLRARPLVHREGGWLLVHAGVLPEWTPSRVGNLAREVEGELQGDLAGRAGRARRLLSTLREPPLVPWRDDLPGNIRRRLALAAFTRLRTMDARGRLCDAFSGPPAQAPAGCRPWFEAPGRASLQESILFGHWAALGLHLTDGLAGLDTGCVWGGALTALRLDDRRVFQEPAAEGGDR